MNFELGSIKISINTSASDGAKKISVQLPFGNEGNLFKITIESNPESNQQAYIAIAIWRPIDK